ncbi:MAG: class I SAM-dependent methyltransferase [Proteobacteria bacterium]|nr:class I SAM-dependent methyltransferase [Pseudomonadota bacterium]MDA1298889.1 class I SAM-dependent methyltransferase [Pseudomonadota bacterium]
MTTWNNGKDNYGSKYWGLIYDQMMERDLPGWLAFSRGFYASHLAGCTGPVLECACGTGLIMLPLIDGGLDVFGFDVSTQMLEALAKKAPEAGFRTTKQSMESFRYDHQFDAVIIPSNSFSMLPDREAQLDTLKNVAAHLNPGGRLLMDIRLADSETLAATADGFEGRWHEWKNPDTGTVIRQQIVAEPHDFANQLYRDRCIFECGTDREEIEIVGRWIFRHEFEALLRSSGFPGWQCEESEWGSYWIAHTP